MSNIDLQTAIEQNLLTTAKHVEERLDAEIHALDRADDCTLEGLRRNRLTSLKQAARKKEAWLSAGHGEYSEVFNEKEFFEQVKGEERAVCHFYRSSLACEAIHRHFQQLSKVHLETKFIKIMAERSPFLAERLRIWMLPTLAIIRDGKVVDYVVGLDEFSGAYDFRTEELAERLRRCGAILEGSDQHTRGSVGDKNLRQGCRFADTKPDVTDEDSDFE